MRNYIEPDSRVAAILVRSCRPILVFAVLFCTAGFAKANDWHTQRTWHLVSPSAELEASLILLQAKKVWLHTPENQVLEVPFSRLSVADQQFVETVLKSKREAAKAWGRYQEGLIRYGQPQLVCHVKAKAVRESSGVDACLGHPGLFWTHNDSGGDPSLYLFDITGKLRGHYLLPDIFPYDWEDICSFEIDGKPYLLIGDVGNNVRASPMQMLHVVSQPEVQTANNSKASELHVRKTFFFVYEDDYRDCEAVAVDPTDNSIYLISKEKECRSFVYRIAWPGWDWPSDKALVARLICETRLPLVTAMDISPDGRRAIVLTYGNAFEFCRNPGESWAEAFRREPREIVMPERSQGEAVCYGHDGKSLYLTSEGYPMPFWCVPVDKP